jgi:putative hydrolase of the HAD superfamily
MIQAVLFDYGLVLSGPPSPAAWASMLEITGLTDEQLHAAYWSPRLPYDRGTHTGSEYWLLAGQLAGLTLTQPQVAALIAADTDLWTQPNQPMIDWAARLQSAGTRTGILSNLGDDMTAGILRKLPWLAGFDHRIFSHTLKLAKPEPEIYPHAAEGLQTPPSEILFVDDRPDNIAAAREAGMQAIVYLNHDDFLAEMNQRGLSDLWLTGRPQA